MTLDLGEILENLTKIVKEEGSVSVEEEKFLNNLSKDIELFQQSVNFSSQDGYISDDQLHEIIIMRDNILTNSIKFNNESSEVENLVRKLYEEINEFTIPGMYEEDIDLVNSKLDEQTSYQPKVNDSPTCTWCNQQAGYKEDEGKFDSRWGARVHRVKMFTCNNCGYTHLFRFGKSIWDFD